MADVGRTDTGASRSLSSTDRKILAEEGIDPSLGGRDPQAEGLRMYVHLLSETLTTRRAADRLGLSPARVRRLLREGRLYGIKAGGVWHVPRWQFVGKALLPGLATVLEAIDPTLHPLIVQGFFRAPQPELAAGSGTGPAFSPIDWLAKGDDPEVVAELAADL